MSNQDTTNLLVTMDRQTEMNKKSDKGSQDVMNDTAVLILSFGTPQTPEDLTPYMQSIRGGRIPTEHELSALNKRYEAIGQWESKELQMMGDQQAQVISELLPHVPVYIGYLHVNDSMAEAVERIVSDGYTHIVAVVTSPFYSVAGTGAYKSKLDAILNRYPKVTVDFIDSWNDQPEFTDYWVNAIQDMAPKDDDMYLFSVHSVPVSTAKDYKDDVVHSAQLIADKANLSKWTYAFQSAPPRGEWLEPTIKDAMEMALEGGAERIIVIPFGFVSNHVEVLYDNDIECKSFVEERGALYERPHMPNRNRLFLQAMASAITERIHT